MLRRVNSTWKQYMNICIYTVYLFLYECITCKVKSCFKICIWNTFHISYVTTHKNTKTSMKKIFLVDILSLLLVRPKIFITVTSHLMFSIAMHRGKNLLERRTHPLQWSAVMSSCSITWCKLWQQYGWQLLYWNAEGCTSYVCHISFQKYKFKHYCMWDIDWKRLFQNVWIIEDMVISQFLAAPFSHCKAMIDNIISSDMCLCPWPLLPLPLFCLYPSTMHPYSSSSSRLLTLMVFWMFIHRQNL